MISRGKYLVELAIANELKQCDTGRPAEPLANQNPLPCINENTQKNVYDDNDDEDAPELLLFNTALSQDCLFANDVAEYGMGVNDEYCVSTEDVLPPNTTINLEAESEDEEAESPNWSPDEEERSSSKSENDFEPHETNKLIYVKKKSY